VLSDENLQVALALENERLDTILGALWEKAQNGDPTSVALMIKVSQRRACLLGLDAPIGHAVAIYEARKPPPLTTTQILRLQIDEIIEADSKDSAKQIEGPADDTPILAPPSGEKLRQAFETLRDPAYWAESKERGQDEREPESSL
jgi:hypothetical protein